MALSAENRNLVSVMGDLDSYSVNAATVRRVLDATEVAGAPYLRFGKTIDAAAVDGVAGRIDSDRFLNLALGYFSMDPATAAAVQMRTNRFGNTMGSVLNRQYMGADRKDISTLLGKSTDANATAKKAGSDAENQYLQSVAVEGVKARFDDDYTRMRDGIRDLNTALGGNPLENTLKVPDLTRAKDNELMGIYFNLLMMAKDRSVELLALP